MEWTEGLVRLDGEPLDPGTLQGKVVLVVNVASKCGFTSQYDGLQALWQERQDEGLVVLGVPCNQFGSQEPGQPEEIVTFCRVNYGVDFPLLEKQNVNGSKRSKLYEYLIGSEVGAGKSIRWNFEKFVVDRSGKVVGRFGSMTKPDSSTLKEVLDQALGS